MTMETPNGWTQEVPGRCLWPGRPPKCVTIVWVCVSQVLESDFELRKTFWSKSGKLSNQNFVYILDWGNKKLTLCWGHRKQSFCVSCLHIWCAVLWHILRQRKPPYMANSAAGIVVNWDIIDRRNWRTMLAAIEERGKPLSTPNTAVGSASNSHESWRVIWTTNCLDHLWYDDVKIMDVPPRRHWVF